MRTRILYIEDKSGGLTGACRIGRVRYSKTGSTLYYGDRAFQSLKGSGYKANYFDTESGAHVWISGPRKDGADGLYGRLTQPEDVDPDVADAYWRDIRGLAPSASGNTPPSRVAPATGTLRVADLTAVSGNGLGRKGQIMAKAMNQRRTQAD